MENKKVMSDKYNKLFQHYYNKIDAKCPKFIRHLDKEVTKSFKGAGIETRPVKSNGIWCCALLPAILLLYSFLHNVTLQYKVTAFLSVGLLSYSILFILFTSVSCLVVTDILYGGCMPSLLVSTMLIYVVLNQSLLFSLVSSATSVYMYSTLLRKSIVLCPKTFTIGEAMIVMQGFTLFVQGAVAQCVLGTEVDEESHLINVIVNTVLLTVGLIVTALYFLREYTKNSLSGLGYIIAASAIYPLLVVHIVLGPKCIINIFIYIFRDQERIKLFAFWLSLLIISVALLIVRTKMAVKATTATRKSFHVLAALVFTSGIVYDVQFMRFAAGIVMGIIIFVEALRKSEIQPISSTLQTAFDIYSDEKDCGSFAMTPIYLYVGLACPLVLVPDHQGARIELLSGVLATGVGDTAASWFGERYGCIKWPEGSRTLEGTAFNILAQVLTIYTLQLFELLDSNSALLRAILAATVSGLVEARIDQVDNLILPLVTIISFQLTFFVS